LLKKENQEEMAGAILKAFGNYKREVEEVPDMVQSSGKKEPTVIEKKIAQGASPAGSEAKAGLQVAYRIQIAASSKSVIGDRYHAIEDLEVIKEGDMYKFVVGLFSSPEAARPRLSALKADGFEGAFIVAYKDGIRIRA
jgi:N-acetylmuramoyl-L-alanine amidase